MKYKEIASAAVGASFFALPYLALSVPLLPSAIIATSAFVATELVMGTEAKTLKETNKDLYDILEEAKKQNKHLISMIPLMNDEQIKIDLTEITETTSKIIDTTIKKPEKAESIHNFFNYYLPSISKIIDHIDEIENQNLNTKDSKNFLKNSNKMISEANKAFKRILSELYESDIVNTGAEMKVFNSMLKSDGFIEVIDTEDEE